MDTMPPTERAPTRPSKPEFLPKEVTGRKKRETPEQEADRVALVAILTASNVPSQAAIELIASYKESREDPALAERMNEIVKEYGIDIASLPEDARRRITILYAGAEHVRGDGSRRELAGSLDEALNEQLMNSAFSHIRGVKNIVSGLSKEASPEKFDHLKIALRESFSVMSALCKRIPPDQTENNMLWHNVYREFSQLVAVKNEASPVMSRAFSEIYVEFNDFIEDEFVTRLMQQYTKRGQSFGVEALMEQVYGRTPEEVESQKKLNRSDVAEEIIAMKDNTYISLEDLLRLHSINNKGVVPKEISRLRKGEEFVGFDQRVGILPDDVREEMEDLMARINLLRVKELPMFIYEIAVAKMHNDMLDIHPFPDRNGSTGLLLVELLMAKKGYEPSPTREKDYYKQLRQVLGNNPVAIGLVGHEQYKIANEPGYFEGRTTKGKEPLYDLILRQMGKVRTKQKIKETSRVDTSGV